MLEQDDKNNFGFQRRKGVFVLNLWQMGGAYHTKEEWLFPVTQSSVCFMSGKPHPAGAHRAVKQTKQCEFTLVVPCGCETATAGRKRNKRLKVRTRRPQVTGEINETIALYMGHWNRLEISDPQSERGYLWSFSSCVMNSDGFNSFVTAWRTGECKVSNRWIKSEAGRRATNTD